MSDPDTGYFVMSIHKHPIIPSYTLCQPATPSVIHGHHYLAAAVVNPLQITMQGTVWLSASKLCKLKCKMCLFVQVSLYKVVTKPIGHSIRQLVFSIFYFFAELLVLESPCCQCSTRKTWVGFKACCVLSESGVQSSHFSPAPARVGTHARRAN